MTSLRAIFAIALLAGVASAAAQQPGALDIRTVVQKEATVVTDDGREEKRLVSADTVVPGDEVVYTLSFENVGSDVAENVVITNPLPAELTYVAGTASGTEATVQFSADGGETYDEADALTVEDDGNRRPAAPADFTHIRWIVARALPPGASGQASFRARLN